MFRIKHRDWYPVMCCFENGLQNGDNISLLCEFLNAEQAFELLEGNGDGSAAHKPHYRGVREEIYQET